mgnify:FL=1
MKYTGGQMIKPRCLTYSSMPIFLSADNRLKPCCFLNTVEKFNEFKKWGEDNGIDVDGDLDITKHNVDAILKSKTWTKLIEGFKTGNTPQECHRSCGPGSYSSTSNTSKHSDYVEEVIKVDSSGLTTRYKEE